MNNKDFIQQQIDLIESKKNKYFIIGFILGMIPYIIILSICYYFNVSSSFNELLCTLGILTALFNGYILKQQALKRLIEFFNIKYNLDYYKIKESI